MYYTACMFYLCVSLRLLEWPHNGIAYGLSSFKSDPYLCYPTSSMVATKVGANRELAHAQCMPVRCRKDPAGWFARQSSSTREVNVKILVMGLIRNALIAVVVGVVVYRVGKFA